jgi:hypothetical protein
MPVWPCFSYPADLPPSVAVPGLRRMPYPCFSYPAMCFSYPGNVTPDTRIRDVAQPASPHAGSMPGYPCFSYPGTPCFRY